MPRVVHFDIDAENPEQLVEFHGKVFGWKFMKWEGPMEYWLITTGGKGEPGIDGGLSRRTPGRPTFDTIDVPDIDEYMKKVEERWETRRAAEVGRMWGVLEESGGGGGWGE